MEARYGYVSESVGWILVKLKSIQARQFPIEPDAQA
jgi:hypothetical protein